MDYSCGPTLWFNLNYPHCKVCFRNCKIFVIFYNYLVCRKNNEVAFLALYEQALLSATCFASSCKLELMSTGVDVRISTISNTFVGEINRIWIGTAVEVNASLSANALSGCVENVGYLFVIYHLELCLFRKLRSCTLK